MTTHVFVVNATTFQIHLEYLFAGTGALDNYIDFNNSSRTTLHHSKENMLIGMVADASRVRKGDQIIFYLQMSPSEDIYEGKFFGIFKAKNDWFFLDNNGGEQYLKSELGKSLTFRTLIEPSKVYPSGVTEWEALDEIKNIQSPNQMIWSLIYRKLKAKRGNTMVTIYEAERLCQLIRDKNNRQELNVDNNKLSFNKDEQKIVLTDDDVNIYNGRMEDVNLLPRLISKYNSDKSFEIHLQAYIVRNIGKGVNESLDRCILGENLEFEWLGNEVSCGVGMQRIDIMISTNQNDQRILLPIELKSVEADVINVKQIQRYVDWIEQYYTPNRQSDIQPFLVSKKIDNKNTEEYQNIVNTFNDFNIKNSRRCNNLRYIEYHLESEELVFEIVNY